MSISCMFHDYMNGACSLIPTFPYFRAMIESLQAENEDLLKNLGLAGSRQNDTRDKNITTKLQNLVIKQGIQLAQGEHGCTISK